LLVLAGALAIFWLLARQATLRQRELALAEWIGNHQSQLIPLHSPIQPVRNLETLSSFHPAYRSAIGNDRWTVAELTTDPPMEAKGKTPRWRVLAWRMPEGIVAWPPTGLRPVAHTVSLVDLPALSSFPSLPGTERFVVFGAESAPAKLLAESPAQGLLPPDIGLLLVGQVLILDFSGRRFDPVEFDRMLALAGQIDDFLSPARARLDAKSANC
jgi:hypothetical protein